MEHVASLTHWLPEDDLKLTSAVQAGASLESLAKGAVQFSRKFSLQELRDRWHSLLYDAGVSAEALARMIEFQQLDLPRRENEREGISRKRKSKSIHRHYSEMRKKLLDERVESTSMNVHAGQSAGPSVPERRIGSFSEGISLSAAVSDNSDVSEYRNGVISCQLDTEDTEIPNNDNVIFPDNVIGSDDANSELSASESDDDDLPNCSDVEAMILDMDLTPDDRDLCYSKRGLRKYESVRSKRTIIRLEQAADACWRRELEANGTFAVIYGRRLEHFIKKNKVVIGRATKEVQVDIDLKKEGPANKISRRQAIIKLSMAGSFGLLNLGKSTMYVNGKEVAPKQFRRLPSNCLIEVKRFAFVFHYNQTLVKRYIENINKGSEAPQQNPSIQ